MKALGVKKAESDGSIEKPGRKSRAIQMDPETVESLFNGIRVAEAVSLEPGYLCYLASRFIVSINRDFTKSVNH